VWAVFAAGLSGGVVSPQGASILSLSHVGDCAALAKVAAANGRRGILPASNRFWLGFGVCGNVFCVWGLLSPNHAAAGLGSLGMYPELSTRIPIRLRLVWIYLVSIFAWGASSGSSIAPLSPGLLLTRRTRRANVFSGGSGQYIGRGSGSSVSICL